MDSIAIVAAASILAAAISMGLGSLGPAIGQGRAIASALMAIAQQPDETGSVTRTLFIGLAMIESLAIYCFVISMILLFANPFWKYVTAKLGG